MQTEIRKGKGIEGLVKAGQVEEARRISTESGHFEELEELYKRELDFKAEGHSSRPILTQILTPEQVNTFLQTTVKYEKHKNYTDSTGLFISRLIQNSYDHGYNSFTLDTTALKEIDTIGYIKGTPRNPIEITIIGNTGNVCGYRTKYITFNITGNIGHNCGFESRNSTFNITGNVGSLCGILSKDSTYKTSNKKTLDRMLKDVNEGNRIIFIHPNGTEEIKRDYER